MVCLVPLVGLVVDVGFIYGVKTQLQASVDGAALAGARAMVLDSSATDSSQTQNNATTWFYANFPAKTWNTSSTALTTPSVYQDCAWPSPLVTPSPCNLNLWHVDVTASTSVPTYFMKWFGAQATSITAVGKASRRNVVAMMVLDRSGSMCTGASSGCGKGSTVSGGNPTACASMITAAKTFTGQFAAGRDYIGMVTFNQGVWVTQPTQSFRTVLGYTDSGGVSNASNLAIDNIKCMNGTGTAGGLSVAYNEMKKLGLAGALNVILLETDGLPNTLSMNWWDGTNNGLSGSSTCKDTANVTKAGGGWTAGTPAATLALQRTWFNSAQTGYTTTSFNTVYGTGTYFSAPVGPYGAFYTSDPAQGSYFLDMYSPWSTSDAAAEIIYNNSTGTSGQSVNCGFTAPTSFAPGAGNDLAWWPNSDIFGSSTNPAICTTGTGPCAYCSSTAYGCANSAVTTTGTPAHVDMSTWQNAKNAVFNAVDNAAYNIRADTALKPVVYVVGLGGNGGDQPDLTLLQRVANDPLADTFNATPSYNACSNQVIVGSAHTRNCMTFGNQQLGTFIYSTSSSSLNRAFVKLSSQALRLNQ